MAKGSSDLHVLLACSPPHRGEDLLDTPCAWLTRCRMVRGAGYAQAYAAQQRSYAEARTLLTAPGRPKLKVAKEEPPYAETETQSRRRMEAVSLWTVCTSSAFSTPPTPVIARNPTAERLEIACKSSAARLLIACKSSAARLQIACKSRATHLQNECKPSAVRLQICKYL